MRILGIDPGSRRTGWGVLELDGRRTVYVASGTVRLNERHPLAERLLVLSRAVEAVLAEHRPTHGALEQIFTARNARSALVLGHARGVILCALASAGLPLSEYAPTQIKQAVVGVGRAEKAQVQQMVGVLLGRRQTWQEDEADALAVALTHAAATRIPNAR